MNTKEMLKRIVVPQDALEAQLREVFGDQPVEEGGPVGVANFEADTILKGRVIDIVNDDVIVDVGYKSEGVISKSEFENPEEIDIGDEVEVLLDGVEDETGQIQLSKRKADRLRGWERVVSTHKEGDTVGGKVVRKIKGGLVVDIGVPAFLPASQVSIRRQADISEFIGQEIQGTIIKIDESRMNIVISRRKLIEEQRDMMKRQLLSEIAEGQVRRGVVKNLADFGAFVDLGGIDGLLHITDMSWGRVSHPSEVVNIDQEIEVVVLKVDRERERIALGLKQLTPSPWKKVDERYPLGTRVMGEVTNLVPYGAFVKLEEGLEGLVHISEMSWTKRINHPSEILAVGAKIEVLVLDINKEKKEISLGMKQTETNPWELVGEKYPAGTMIEGVVRNLTNYGAFVEIEEGIDGLLHVSDMSWTKKVAHPNEVIQKGDKIRAVVLSVDQDKKRVALGVKQLNADPWKDAIPMRYGIGTVVEGAITKITNFGVFVELEPELEGLLHVSELTDKKDVSPEDIVKVGDKVKVKVLRVDAEERKIGLTMFSDAPPDAVAVAEGEEDLSRDRKKAPAKKKGA
jgi:small subunit ribosomal protein S1